MEVEGGLSEKTEASVGRAKARVSKNDWKALQNCINLNNNYYLITVKQLSKIKTLILNIYPSVSVWINGDKDIYLSIALYDIKDLIGHMTADLFLLYRRSECVDPGDNCLPSQ